MFWENKDKHRLLTPIKNKNSSILEDAKFIFPDDRKKAQLQKEGGINYVKRPIAKGSTTSLLCALISAAFLYAAFRIILFTKGNPDMTVSALVFSSLVFSLGSLWFGASAFKDKMAKHFLAFLGLGIGGIQFVIWMTVLILGYRLR